MLYSYPSSNRENNYHVVKEGDTLYTISKFYSVSLDEIVETNPDIDPGSIAPGHSIFIPLTAPAVSCPKGATSYIIQKGDNFYTIAGRFKMHLTPLLKANPGINPDALLIGQKLCIPAISSVYTNAAYRIKLSYPYLWSKIDNERYEGIDGFFQVSTVSSDGSFEEVCTKEAYHKLKPYGAQPCITAVRTEVSEYCMIIPSEDQLHEMRGQAALIIKYNVPIEIKGKSCSYLIIWTDKNHIRDIADSIEFLEG